MGRVNAVREGNRKSRKITTKGKIEQKKRCEGKVVIQNP